MICLSIVTRLWFIGVYLCSNRLRHQQMNSFVCKYYLIPSSLYTKRNMYHMAPFTRKKHVPYDPIYSKNMYHMAPFTRKKHVPYGPIYSKKTCTIWPHLLEKNMYHMAPFTRKNMYHMAPFTRKKHVPYIFKELIYFCSSCSCCL